MPTERVNTVRSFEVSLMCECGGEIIHIPFSEPRPPSTKQPAEFQHQCDKCQAHSWQEAQYPEVRFERVN